MAWARWRALVRNLAAALAALFLFLLVAELVLRLLPVRSSLAPVAYAGGTDPVYHLHPSQRFTFSVGPLLRRPHRGRINNVGFANPADYDSLATSPLLAVLGDSYVEALSTPPESTLGAVLASAATPGRVYTFGVRGAPFSQYVAYAAYARRTFRPAALAAVIIGNDYDASLERYSRIAGFCQYTDALELRCTPYRETTARRWLRHSAIVRYLVLNGEIHYASSWLASRLRLDRSATPAAGGTEGDRLAWSQRAVDTFLRDFRDSAGVPARQLILVVDGIRPALYDSAALAATNGSFTAGIRSYLLASARAAGYDVVDLQPVLTTAFATTGRRLDYGKDPHWNGDGHRLVAEAVRATAAWRATFGSSEAAGHAGAHTSVDAVPRQH